MNPIEQQQKLIGQLYEIVRKSTPSSTETSNCVFDYKRYEDGSSSVGQQFEYEDSGKVGSAALYRTLRAPVLSIAKELHRVMKSHTGGDWSEFTLTINQNGSVSTKFKYPEETQNGHR